MNDDQISATFAKLQEEAQRLVEEAERRLGEARRKAETLDTEARELARLTALAEKYGYTLTKKVSDERGPDFVAQQPDGTTLAVEVKNEMIPAERQARLRSVELDLKEPDALLRGEFTVIECKHAPLADGPAYRAAICVAENALRAAQGPLELNQIYDACLSAKVPLAGKRPLSTLSAYLSHEKSTVKSIRKGVYWLKDEPLPKGFGALWKRRDYAVSRDEPV
jgi:hypothetical protein